MKHFGFTPAEALQAATQYGGELMGLDVGLVQFTKGDFDDVGPGLCLDHGRDLVERLVGLGNPGPVPHQ